MENNRLKRLSKMLQQIEAKPDNLTTSLESFLKNATQASGGGKLDVSHQEVEIATESLDFLLQGKKQNIDSDRQHVLEAIVMPYYRPVIRIMNSQIVTDDLSLEWQHLGKNKLKPIIESTFSAIGRLETSNPSR